MCVCASASVYLLESMSAWAHLCVCVCVCNSCVCVSLLLPTSNWIFCPEFCLFLWAEEKQRKGTTRSIVAPFELSPTHLQNKRRGRDWIDQNARSPLHIGARERTSQRITPFVQVLSVWDWDVSVGLKSGIRCCHSTDRQPRKLQKKKEERLFDTRSRCTDTPSLDYMNRKFREFREC